MSAVLPKGATTCSPSISLHNPYTSMSYVSLPLLAAEPQKLDKLSVGSHRAAVGLLPKPCSYALIQGGNVYIHHWMPARSDFILRTLWQDLETFLLQLGWLLVGGGHECCPTSHCAPNPGTGPATKKLSSPKCLPCPGGETLMYIHTDAWFVTT